MKSLLSFCVDHARGVILVLVATVLVGLYSFTRLPVDAVPDISPVQVQVNTLVKGLAPEEVEKQVKIEFPNKFTNPNRNKPGAVEGSSNKGGKSTGEVSLSDEERRVMQTFVRTGALTEKEYIESLRKVRG